MRSWSSERAHPSSSVLRPRRRDALEEVRCALPSISRPFVLGVGGADARKNWAALVRGFAALPTAVRDELQLVVVSNAVIGDTLRALLAETRLRDDSVVLASTVSDALLRALYQSAALFVLPSVYEGFGLPALEAVRCGCPTITSDTTSLPEVLQYPPATFPPHDIDALSRLMHRALKDEHFRSELVDAGQRAAGRHTWQRVADRSLRALQEIRVPQGARAVPKRVAILGLGSTDGGSVVGLPIGALDAVAERVDLDCFEIGDRRPQGRSGRRWRVFPMRAFGPTFTPDAYDAVLTVFDGSTADRALAERFVEAPGIAYLRADPGRSRDIIEFARGLLFPSDAACRSARDADLARLPHAVLPLPVPSGRGGPEAPAAHPVLVVPGAMPDGERLECVVEAFALIRREWRGRLLFLGGADIASRRRLMESAQRLAVAPDVSWTDRVPHDEYRARLAVAWCGVCLGAGWSSGGHRPLLDTLAAGTPVVSDRADAAELPTEAVVALAAPAHAVELAAALRTLLDPAVRASRAADAQRYAATWNASAFADSLVASLEELVAPPRALVPAT